MTTIAQLQTDAAKKQHVCVDIVKLLLSIIVVTAHVNPMRDVNVYLAFGLEKYLARIPVPFFLIASGYFCFRKIPLERFDAKVALRYAVRILKLYFLWVAIYLPLIIYGVWSGGLVDFWGGVRVIAKNIFVAGCSHLWYLLADFWAVVLVTLALKKKLPIPAILAGGGLLYLVGALGNTYFGLLKHVPFLQKLMQGYLDIFETTRNGLFMCVLFVALGAYLAYYKVSIKRWIAVAGLVVSAGLMLVEAYLLEHFRLTIDHNLYIFAVPTGFFLFYVALHTDIKRLLNGQRLRVYSSMIYFPQIAIAITVLPALTKLIRHLTGSNYTMHSLLQFSIVMACAVACAFAVDHLQHRKGFRWLKKLL